MHFFLFFLQDDLTMSMVEKCKESQPVVQRIVESTVNDEGMLFEALYLHDELQKVISKYEEMEANSMEQQPPPENNHAAAAAAAMDGSAEPPVELKKEAKTSESPKGESSEAGDDDHRKST